jgi:hypothetical protein
MAKVLLSFICLIISPMALADGSQGSAGGSSDISAKNLSQIASGSTAVLTGTSQLTVAAIQVSGDVASVTLRAAADSAEVVVTIGADVLRASKIVLGETLQVVSKGTGSLLVGAGQVIAFIPNELGKAMLYSFPRD